MSLRRPLPTVLAALAAAWLPAVAPAAGWPPRWSPAEGWTLAPAASVQYDLWHADRDGGSLRADGFRRQRLALNLGGPRGLAAKVEYDAVPGAWTDVFVRLRLGEATRLRIGQGKTPMGLEALASHRHLSHLERAPMTSLVPGRALGLEAQWSAGDRTLALAVLDGNLNTERRGPGLFARTTRRWQFTSDRQDRLHLGLSAGIEQPDGPIRLRGRPDVGSLLPLTLVDSGMLHGVDRIDRVGVEAAWDRGPFSLQAEQLWLRARVPGGSRRADGGYLTASWRPTGESRRYRDGVFEGFAPDRRWGAVELSLRASRLAVADAADVRRSGHSFALAATWQLATGVRVSAQLGNGQGDAEASHGLRLHGWF